MTETLIGSETILKPIVIQKKKKTNRLKVEM